MHLLLPAIIPGLLRWASFQGYGACAYFASEWHRDGYELNDYRHVHTEYGCLTANTANHYWVQYVGSDNGGNGDLRMNVDLTVMDYTPWNPYAYWLPASYGPFSTQFAAETKYLGTDIPTSNFSSMQVQQFDDTWTNTLPPLYDGCPWPARYINGGLSNNFFAIQTYGTSSNYNC